MAATLLQPASDRGQAKSHTTADAERRNNSTLREREYCYRRNCEILAYFSRRHRAFDSRDLIGQCFCVGGLASGRRCSSESAACGGRWD